MLGPTDNYLDLDLLLERVRLFVASEAHSRVLKQLVPDHIAKRVVLLPDGHSALMPLATVLLVGDPAMHLDFKLTYICWVIEPAPLLMFSFISLKLLVILG